MIADGPAISPEAVNGAREERPAVRRVQIIDLDRGTHVAAEDNPEEGTRGRSLPLDRLRAARMEAP